MELVPRTVPATGYGEKGVRDVWLDAAQAAVIGGHPEIAVQLLQAGMPYAQRGPLTGSSNPLFLRVEGGDRPIMNLAAQRGDTVTLRRLVELGAPVEGDAGERHGNTPLAEAVAQQRPEAARILLAAGADPALQRDNYDSRSALEQAVTAGDTALLRELLKAARPDTLQALMRHPTRSPVLLALKQPGADGLAMLRLWVDAGFDLKTLDADAIRQAVSSRNEALAIYLIDAGVPVNPRPPAAADGDGASQDHADEPPLLAAAILRQDAIVDRLLAKGADPAGLASDGQSALYWLIAQGNQAGLDRLLRGGARLDDPRLPLAPAPYALINAAAGSGDIALARRVAQATGRGWTAPACPTAANSVCSTDPVISPACSNWASTVAPPTAARRWDGACWRPVAGPRADRGAARHGRGRAAAAQGWRHRPAGAAGRRRNAVERRHPTRPQGSGRRAAGGGRRSRCARSPGPQPGLDRAGDRAA